MSQKFNAKKKKDFKSRDELNKCKMDVSAMQSASPKALQLEKTQKMTF